MTDLSKILRAKLAGLTGTHSLKIITETAGADGSRKFLVVLTDGKCIECVLIPDGERLTACLSSQVGCVVGCQFCATGQMKFGRNLTSGEIIEQLFALEDWTGSGVSNIVMMGMGEPFLNLNNLLKAIRIITDPEGVGIPPRKFTLSTVGWLPGIKALAQTDLKVKLAVSIIGTSDEQRHQLTPLAARFPLVDIITAANNYAIPTGHPVSFNYLLLSGMNDSLEDAQKFVKLIKHVYCKINIMEYNTTNSTFHRSSDDRVEMFRGILQTAGLTVTVRTSRGKDIAAACGQLAAG